VHVEKWYLDCVTPEGAGMIGYAGRIRLGPVTVPCFEMLVWRAGGPVRQSHTMAGGRLPTATADEIVWRSNALKVDGHWWRRGPAIAPTVLHAEAAGEVEWACLCPAAQVAVTVDGEPYAGTGYAERLIMTLSPGRLPIRELRWGRFISVGQSCVWIQWRGAAERTWCFHNGQAVSAAMPDLLVLTWNGHRLKLDPGTIIRSGRLADTAFKHAGPLRWLLPANVRQLRETKWCSRGVLTDAVGREHAGWAIHEVALFP
jgi:hypothetical protein